MARKARKQRILIIEDDAQVMKLLSTLLERKGYEVVKASYALPALFRVTRRPPDLILADLNMPIMNGLDLIGQFKSYVETRDIPIVVVTGSNPDENREAAFQAGCAGFLTKPIDALKFADQIAEFLPHPKSRRT
jgi:CheY-like chemotaxis protein